MMFSLSAKELHTKKQNIEASVKVTYLSNLLGGGEAGVGLWFIIRPTESGR